MQKQSLTKIETEMKFVVSNETTFQALKIIETLDDFNFQAKGTKTVKDRYMDTADQLLLKAGYACRIRYGKQKQVLTLKSLTPPDGDVHRRTELETNITTDDMATWGESTANTLLLSIIGRAKLQTLFLLHQIRHKYIVLRQNKTVIEFSLDKVLAGDTDEVDYFELEAELIEAGTETDLAEFIEMLQQKWPLTPEHKSKFERALNKTI